MKINITGDFYISNKIKDSSHLVEDLIPFFKDSDYNIVNLESPITNNNNKIIKVGPHLNGHKHSINLLRELKVNLVTLANNHILDYGESGLKDTLKLLDESSIDRIGAGVNIVEASKSFRIVKDGLKIAVLNFAENEWSIATENKSGANPLDIIENVKQIKQAKEVNDIVICIIHGGHEYYHLPSPRIVKHYRFYAENGADAIICHHTHCISGYEIYKNVPIFYSLGNFIFTKESKHECWYFGLVLQLNIQKNKSINFELYPTMQDKKDSCVRFLHGSKRNEIMSEIMKYNEIILNDVLLRNSWNSFLVKNSKEYLMCFSPINIINNRFIRAGLRRLNIDKLLMRNNSLKEILNYIQCESHIDACKEVIRTKLKK
jgi:poly-gamma-glutamate synthesis protein (capsule biosynthesis protein)